MRFIQFIEQIELIREDLASNQQLEASYRQECRFPPSRATNPAGSFARSRGQIPTAPKKEIAINYLSLPE